MKDNYYTISGFCNFNNMTKLMPFIIINGVNNEFNPIISGQTEHYVTHSVGFYFCFVTSQKPSDNQLKFIGDVCDEFECLKYMELGL